MSTVHEEWLPVVGYEGWYSVSNVGRVRRDKSVAGTRPGKILKPQTIRYARVTLSRNNRVRVFAVHRLVAAAFLGPLPSGHQVNHRNGDKLDNRVENLEYVTASRNIHHAYETGLKPYGERHPQARLTNRQVRTIKSLAGTMPAKAVGERFGVSSQAIQYIWNGKNRRHL